MTADRIGTRRVVVGAVRAFALSAVAFAALGMATLFALQRRIVFPLTTTVASVPPRGWTSVRVGGGLHAWASRWERGRRTVVMFHGNAVPLAAMATVADRWSAEGWNVVLAEFPGYDGNPGSPSEAANGWAAVRTWDWAVSNGAPPARSVVLAYSIGTGAAAWIAESRPFAGLLVVSGMDDMGVVVRSHVPFVARSMVLDRMGDGPRIAAFRGRVAIWHGRSDEVVPPSEGAALGAAARVPVRWRDGGHQMFWTPSVQDEVRATAAAFAGG